MGSPLQRQAIHNSPLQSAANASPQVTQLMAMQDAANQSEQVSAQADLQEGANAGGGLAVPGLEAGNGFSDSGEEVESMIDDSPENALEIEDEGMDEMTLDPSENADEPVMQRALAWNNTNNRMLKKGRHSFATMVTKGMGLKSGQARCHVISYEIICAGVKDVINEVLAGNRSAKWAKAKLLGLVESVYPNGPTTKRHSGNATLQKAAAKYYKVAIATVGKIRIILSKSKLKLKDRDRLKILANMLIKALNNSPDNLRPGDSSTNSSIGGSLDLIQTGTQFLPKGTKFTFDGVTFDTLKKKKEVLNVDKTNAKSVKTLLTDTYSELGEIYVYSSGNKLQSSEKKGMKAGNMSTSNVTPLSIPWDTDSSGNPVFRFFET